MSLRAHAERRPPPCRMRRIANHQEALMQNADWQTEIVAVEEAANTAFLNRDLARLDQLFSDELLVNSPINIINNKPKLIELLGAGVIVMGSDTVKSSPSEPTLRRRFTNIWRREGDCWRLYIR